MFDFFGCLFLKVFLCHDHERAPARRKICARALCFYKKISILDDIRNAEGAFAHMNAENRPQHALMDVHPGTARL